MRPSHCVSIVAASGRALAALAHCHSVVLASPYAAPGITTRPSGADICPSIDHKGLALDQTDCDRKLLFSPQKRPNACVRVIEWNSDAVAGQLARGRARRARRLWMCSNVTHHHQHSVRNPGSLMQMPGSRQSIASQFESPFGALYELLTSRR